MPSNFRVAVIGSTGRGAYGHGIDTVWADVPETTLVAVADDNKEGLAAAASRLKVDRTYLDWREMLDKEKPDIVGIGPRWIDRHKEMVVGAAERGIHMFMEKPFVRTPEEADECVAACERTHVLLALAHQTRWSPKLDIVKQLVAEGKIGRVLELRGRGKEDARGGGEDLWVLGSHVLDLVRAVGGDAKWCSAIVTQDGRPVTKSDVVEGNEGIGPLAGDAIQATYGLTSGAIATFGSVRRAGGKLPRFGLQIYGSTGVIEILTGHLPSVKYLDDSSWCPGRSGAAWQDVSSAGIGQAEPLKDGGLGGGNGLAVRDLLKCIEEKRQPRCNVYEGRAIIEMISAVYESHRTGGRVELPLANRKNPLTMLA